MHKQTITIRLPRQRWNEIHAKLTECGPDVYRTAAVRFHDPVARESPDQVVVRTRGLSRTDSTALTAALAAATGSDTVVFVDATP